MKNFVMMAAALVLGFSLSIGEAEAAKRLGGGGSTGMQRQSVAPSPAQAPQKAAPASAPQAPAAAPQAQPKRSWMGPLAGLAAGLGLAALASHFGFGEGLANMMMIGLLIMAVVMVVGFIMRKKAGAGGPQPAYAGGVPNHAADYAQPNSQYQGNANYGGVAPVAAAASTARIPADFDVDGFVRNAKVMFIRLQAANDAKNLDDIREFTSPEMFGEIKLAFAERADAAQETDVVQLNAAVLDVAEEGANYVVSVQFDGQIREERNGPVEAFQEMWHLIKPRDGSRGWTLAGIQQIQ